MAERLRFNQTQTLAERMAEEAKRLRAQARLLAPGIVRDDLLRKARQAETAAHMDDWLRSPGLKSPTP